MDDLFLILAFASTAALAVGLVKPSLVVRWGEDKTRKSAVLAYGLLTLVFFIGFGVVQPLDTQPMQTETETKMETKMFGYTEAELKEIYKEVVAAEDAGRREGEEQCPTDITNPDYQQDKLEECLNLQTDLSRQNRGEVLQKYSLTKDQWSEISVKANKENWPIE